MRYAAFVSACTLSLCEPHWQLSLTHVIDRMLSKAHAHVMRYTYIRIVHPHLCETSGIFTPKKEKDVVTISDQR